MKDNDLMPFGKYRGEKLANVPASYLLWLREKGYLYGPLLGYVIDNIDSLEAEKKKEDFR